MWRLPSFSLGRSGEAAIDEPSGSGFSEFWSRSGLDHVGSSSWASSSPPRSPLSITTSPLSDALQLGLRGVDRPRDHSARFGRAHRPAYRERGRRLALEGDGVGDARCAVRVRASASLGQCLRAGVPPGRRRRSRRPQFTAPPAPLARLRAAGGRLAAAAAFFSVSRSGRIGTVACGCAARSTRRGCPRGSQGAADAHNADRSRTVDVPEDQVPDVASPSRPQTWATVRRLGADIGETLLFSRSVSREVRRGSRYSSGATFYLLAGPHPCEGPSCGRRPCWNRSD